MRAVSLAKIPPETVSARGFLWFTVPAFVGGMQSVTVVQTTHPEFRESMRLFGVPADHGSRLENHPGITPNAAPNWCIILTGMSPLGVGRYHIRDPDRPDHRLVVADNGTAQMQDVGWVEAKDKTWYIVPCPPYGWDLVYASTGARLEAQADGQLRAVPNLGGDTHFDFLRYAPTAADHRSHFWLPPFFAQTMCNVPRRPVRVAGMQAVVGTHVGANSRPETQQMEEEAFVRRCASDDACNAAWVDSEGKCNRWVNAVPDPSLDMQGDYADLDRLTADQAYPYTVLERERRLFGDSLSGRWKNNGGGFAGSETARRGNIVMYVRHTEPDLARAYRTCLLGLGPDAPECADLLSTAGNEDAQLLVKKNALGQWSGKSVQGICGPLGVGSEALLLSATRLWSGTCRGFCRTLEARSGAQCEAGYRTHCAPQTAGGANDPMCNCYLAPTTYEAIRAAANKDLGENSPLAAQIQEIIRQKGMADYCWYAPCRETDNRPPDANCPTGDTYTCVQISKDMTFAGGGGATQAQQCSFAAGDEWKSPPVTTPTNDAPPLVSVPAGKGANSSGSASGPSPPTPPPENSNTTYILLGTLAAAVVIVLLLLVLITT